MSTAKTRLIVWNWNICFIKGEKRRFYLAFCWKGHSIAQHSHIQDILCMRTDDKLKSWSYTGDFEVPVSRTWPRPMRFYPFLEKHFASFFFCGFSGVEKNPYQNMHTLHRRHRIRVFKSLLRLSSLHRWGILLFRNFIAANILYCMTFSFVRMYEPSAKCNSILVPCSLPCQVIRLYTIYTTP